MSTTYRVNPFKEEGDPVIVASARAARPHTARRHTGTPGQGASGATHDPLCPFCTGNEEQTPPELDAFRPGGSRRDSAGWSVRVVPNLYPALTSPPQGVSGGEEIVFAPDELYDTTQAEGLHEVAIHSPDHSGRLGSLSTAALTRVLKMWQRRLHVHRSLGWRVSTLVVNEGREAGASLAHPHAQIFATDLVPPALERELWVQEQYAGREGRRRLLDDVISAEIEDGSRIVDSQGPLVAWVPYWAEVPYEMWLAPRERDTASGNLADSPLVTETAALLGRCAARIAEAADDPALNLVVRDVPHDGSGTARWYMRIVPRTSIAAGFELATGMRIVTVAPEDAAATLREMG